MQKSLLSTRAQLLVASKILKSPQAARRLFSQFNSQLRYAAAASKKSKAASQSTKVESFQDPYVEAFNKQHVVPNTTNAGSPKVFRASDAPMESSVLREPTSSTSLSSGGSGSDNNNSNNTDERIIQEHIDRANSDAGKYRWYAFAALSIAAAALATSLFGAYFTDAGQQHIAMYLSVMITDLNSEEAKLRGLTADQSLKAFESIAKLAQNNSMWQVLRRCSAVDCLSFVLKTDSNPEHLKFAAKAMNALVQERTLLLLFF